MNPYEPPQHQSSDRGVCFYNAITLFFVGSIAGYTAVCVLDGSSNWLFSVSFGMLSITTFLAGFSVGRLSGLEDSQQNTSRATPAPIQSEKGP